MRSTLLINGIRQWHQVQTNKLLLFVCSLVWMSNAFIPNWIGRANFYTHFGFRFSTRNMYVYFIATIQCSRLHSRQSHTIDENEIYKQKLFGWHSSAITSERERLQFPKSNIQVELMLLWRFATYRAHKWIYINFTLSASGAARSKRILWKRLYVWTGKTNKWIFLQNPFNWMRAAKIFWT